MVALLSNFYAAGAVKSMLFYNSAKEVQKGEHLLYKAQPQDVVPEKASADRREKNYGGKRKKAKKSLAFRGCIL